MPFPLVFRAVVFGEGGGFEIIGKRSIGRSA